MKKSIILSLAIALGSLTFLSNMGEKESKKMADTDKYRVIRVDGRIIFQRSKEDMKKGDVFLSGTAISFKTPESRAAVISAIKGRFVLSGSQKGSTKILPAANSVPSRSGGLVNELDFKKCFSENCLFLGETSFEVGGDYTMDDESKFYYLVYKYEGERVRKKLTPVDEKHFMVDADEIFMIDGEPITVVKDSMTLFFRSGSDSYNLATFNPIFPDEKELKEEVEIIVDEFSEKDDLTKINEVGAYLQQFYGKTQRQNLEEWLNAEFSLKGRTIKSE